jgi:flavin-dependent dehydrogenase
VEGVDLKVDVFEWRSFSEKGPRGCNRCAGILSASFLRNLKEFLGLSIPEDVVQNHITSYHLHSPYGSIRIDTPEPEAEIMSVFRGGGPLYSPEEELKSFDGFLMAQALQQGANHLQHRVQRVEVLPRPTVFLDHDKMEYDLVVLASGLNTGTVNIVGLPYSPPPTLPMSQDELAATEPDVQEYFGKSVHAVLLPHSDLVFGTLVPKGRFINVSLLGKSGPPDLETFLENPLAREILPFHYNRACGCRPRISVGIASNYCGDGFVAVGDAAVSRLYKDGIGSALLTAREAARTAVYHGVSRDAFARHYIPLCHRIHQNNRLGKRLFAVHHRAKDFASFFRATSRLIQSEGSLKVSEHVFSRILWGMFTGSYAYKEIWEMSKRPRTLLRLASGYIQEALK